MSISIICPLYNSESYIINLHESIKNQVEVDIVEIKYILTESQDSTKSILEKYKIQYKEIKRNDFSHSLTREKEVYSALGDIIVFITQDIIIKDKLWLYKLTKDITNGNCEASFSKQICENSSIERYTRMNNYPNESRVVSKKDVERLGIMTYFYSDAASAIRKDVFIKLNGYDNKNLLTNEDMYIAYKLINNGYRIRYCADAEVIHSHEYSFKSLFKRYFDQGVFLKQHSYITEAGAGSGAFKLVKFVAKNALKEKNLKVILNIIPNFGVRFIANKFGKNYNSMKKERILRYTSNKSYWLNTSKK